MRASAGSVGRSDGAPGSGVGEDCTIGVGGRNGSNSAGAASVGVGSSCGAVVAVTCCVVGGSAESEAPQPLSKKAAQIAADNGPHVNPLGLSLRMILFVGNSRCGAAG